MERKDFLIEIGVEELPAGFLAPAEKALADGFRALLSDLRLACGEIESFSTPRRLALLARELETRQADRTVEVKGPSKKAAFSDIGRPTQAAVGFAESNGLAVESLVLRATPKGEYLYAEKKEAGQPAADLLRDALPKLIASIPFRKSMVWEAGQFRFGRPIRWILCLLGEERVKFKLAGVSTCNTTHALRADGPDRITVEHPADYEKILLDRGVIARATARRARTLEAVEAAAVAARATAVAPAELIDEIANLVEHPNAIVGAFDEEYLVLPEEVLTNTMMKHQRYVPLRNERGLVAKFIAVANGPTVHAANVADGASRVLAARLADAKFYFHEDQKVSLTRFAERLARVTFHEKLGSLAAKVERVKDLVRALAPHIAPAGHEALLPTALQVADLCKADLQTMMVFEFPELQGRIGQVYAANEGIAQEVADGIAEHYLPRFRGDAMPASAAGRLVGIADRLDTLCGGFLAGLKPTGSADPFGLRRAAFGLVEGCIECGVDFPLAAMVERSVERYRAGGVQGEIDHPVAEIVSFVHGRLETSLKDRGIRYDTVDAVLASAPDGILACHRRALALEACRDAAEFRALITPGKRAANLVRKEKGGTGPIDPARFADPSEGALHAALTAVQAKVEAALASADDAAALSALSGMNRTMDDYFAKVLVMHEDPAVRENRLATLAAVAALFRRVADLSKLVVEGEK